VIALSVAALLMIFLVYTAIGGVSLPLLQPSNLAGAKGKVSLTGKVVGTITGDAKSSGGLRFSLHNINGPSPTVPVAFHGAVPDLFKAGRDVNVTGQLESDTFVATSMTTKCPSKYTAAA
jgi:cytochrome c-type biogenesis protein CcmE